MNRARQNTPPTPDNMNGRVGGSGTDMNGIVGGRNTDMNGTGGRNMNNTMGNTRLGGTLEEQIRALGFVKAELELYLDTHPTCRIALDYYHRTIDELRRLTEEYHNTYGPLSADGVVSNDEWTWVRLPWPWHRTGDYMQPREGDR